MLLNENKNYFTTTFWPFMILIPFLGSDRRVTVFVPSVTVATRARGMMMMVFLFIILIEFYTQYIVMRDIF